MLAAHQVKFTGRLRRAYNLKSRGMGAFGRPKK